VEFGVLAAVMFALWPTNVTYSISGMETSVVTMLVFTTFMAYAHRKAMLTTVLGALAVFFV